MPETQFTNELRSIRETEARKLGPDLTAAYESSLEDLSRSGIDDRALKVGDNAPDFELINHEGRPVRLSTCLEGGPVVLSFYRGGWCPFCNAEARALQNVLPRIEGFDGRVLGISPQRPEHAAEMVREHGLEFDLLSDPQNTVARKFGVVFHLPDEIQSVYDDLGLDLPLWNDDDSFDLPVPATYVVDTAGVIRLAFVDPDYTRRLDPTEILRVLRTLTD